MRRKDKEILAKEEMEQVIKESLVCRLALCTEDQPYIVPLCFGYTDGLLYFHGAPEGQKINMLRENPNVCFEFDVDVEVVPAETACEWRMRYRSVIGVGTAAFVEELKEKEKALDAILSQYSDGAFSFPEKTLANMSVIRVEIESMTCKESKWE